MLTVLVTLPPLRKNFDLVLCILGMSIPCSDITSLQKDSLWPWDPIINAAVHNYVATLQSEEMPVSSSEW